MNNTLETKLIEFEGDKLLGVRAEDGKIYLGIKKAMKGIGFTERQSKYQGEKLQEDIVLNRGVLKISLPSKGGNQLSTCLEMKYVPIWLSKINTKSLNENQYNKLIKLLNFCLSSDFDSLKSTSKVYSFESEFRDEIFNLGYFDNIKILDKEVPYDFGRIDLLGEDEYHNKICIELKRYKEFGHIKDQLLKYKNSNKFKRVIYCAYLIDPKLSKWCSTNNIECYTYKRDLSVIPEKDFEFENTILDINIENLKFGLDNYIPIKGVIPTLEQIDIYKNKVISFFNQYKSKLEQVINSTNHNLVIRHDIILYYLKNCYESDIAELVDVNFDIDEQDIVNIYGTDYLRSLNYPKILKVQSFFNAHSSKYKKESRMYFKNLWLSFCKEFEVSTYKDLNPLNYNDGFRFIENWSMM